MDMSAHFHVLFHFLHYNDFIMAECEMNMEIYAARGSEPQTLEWHQHGGGGSKSQCPCNVTL